jgi:hypothetical protein
MIGSICVFHGGKVCTECGHCRTMLIATCFRLVAGKNVPEKNVLDSRKKRPCREEGIGKNVLNKIRRKKRPRKKRPRKERPAVKTSRDPVAALLGGPGPTL